jgi:polyisoprenoid-binding protein YceI
MKKQFNILYIALVAGLFFFSSFVGITEYGETPGYIRAIGEAGSPNVFTFNKWSITKAEMPEDKVENIKVEIEINTSSLSTDWKDLENNVKKKKDYFYIKKFPKATVSIDGAEQIEEGRYQTEAQLTLKGITKSVLLTFTMEGNTVRGEGVIQRRAFKFTGDGPKDEVPVSFEAVLPL